MAEDNLDIGRAAFDFVYEIERMPDRQLVMDRLGRELSNFGFHAWLITGLPNPGDRIDPLMMINGWPAGWTELYTKQNLASMTRSSRIASDRLLLSSGQTRPMIRAPIRRPS